MLKFIAKLFAPKEPAPKRSAFMRPVEVKSSEALIESAGYYDQAAKDYDNDATVAMDRYNRDTATAATYRKMAAEFRAAANKLEA